MKRIIITEEQLRHILGEGTDFGARPDGTLGFSFNNDRSDKANNFLDTRFFRNASDILYKNRDENTPTMLHKRVDRQRMHVDNYEKILTYLDAHKNDPNLQQNLLNDATLNRTISRDVLNDISKELSARGYDETYSYCWKKLRDNRQWLNMSDDLKTRANVKYMNHKSGYDENDRMAQYALGKVPDTDIEVISLFSMNGFNPSDVLKNGNARYDDYVISQFGLDKEAENIVNSYTDADWNNLISKKGDYGKKTWAQLSSQEKDKLRNTELKTITKRLIPKVQEPGKVGRAYDKANVKYDNGITPDIRNNFSLPQDYETNTEHYRDNSNRTSVSTFIDKSILCANYALNELNYHPNFIVSAPSSSKFNDFYCARLSQKLGVPYLKNFFLRNLINISYDEETERKLDMEGATQQDKENIKTKIKSAVYAEITSKIISIIKDFVGKYWNALSTIPISKYNRQKVNDTYLIKTLLYATYNDLMTYMPNTDIERKNNVYRSIARQMLRSESQYNGFKATGSIDSNFIMQEFTKKIKQKIGINIYTYELIEPIDNIIQTYSDRIDDGFMLNTKKFKIVDIDARFRKCLGNVYIISDKYLRKYGNDIQKQYEKSKFLIFDEDIDTGATLRIVVDLLQEKIDANDGQIKCLTNGYNRGYEYK